MGDATNKGPDNAANEALANNAITMPAEVGMSTKKRQASESVNGSSEDDEPVKRVTKGYRRRGYPRHSPSSRGTT